MVINSNLSAPGVLNTQATAKAAPDLAAIEAAAVNPAQTFSSSLDPQIGSINSAQTDVANVLSLTQTQSGFLQNIGQALDQMAQLATAAQDPAATATDRASANQQFQSLTAYITKAAGLDFNGVSLFNGSPLSVSADPNGGVATLPGVNLNASVYIALASADISTPQGPPASGATGALASVQAALKQFSTDRATVTTNQSQLETTVDQLAISSENLSALTFISSFDAADQSTTAASGNILNQSNSALLAQANQMPQSVLNLLQ